MYVKVWDSGKVLVVMLDGILSQMGWGCRKFENIELGLKIDPDYPISQFLSGSKYNTCLISVLYDLNLAVKLNPDKILSRIRAFIYPAHIRSHIIFYKMILPDYSMVRIRLELIYRLFFIPITFVSK